MRTKNAKRLWPVPVTLGVMALAALLAFGLMATNGAQPAAAQDDPDCEVAVAIDADGTATATVTDGFSDDDEDCRARGGTATIRFTGPATAPAGVDDPGKLDLLIQDDNGPIRAYVNGTVDFDAGNTEPNNRYEITSIGATAELGTQDEEAPSPMRWRIERVEVPLPARDAQGQIKAQSADVTVSGNVYIFGPDAAVTSAITGVPEDFSDKRDETVSRDDDETVTILFLGEASLGEDGDDINDTLDDVEQCVVVNSDPPREVMREAGQTSCPTSPASTVDTDDDPESRSKLFVVTDESTAAPTKIIGARTETHDMTGNSGRESVTIYAVLQDADENPLTGIDVDFTASPTPNDIVAPRDLVDDDETAAFGDDVTVTGIAETDAVAKFQVEGLPTNISYVVSVEVMAGDFSLGTVEIARKGDATKVIAGVFNAACFDPAGTDDEPNYANATFDADAKGCDASGMANHFGHGEMIFVKAHHEDDLDLIVGDGDDLSAKLANEDDDLLGEAKAVLIEDPVMPGDPARAWIFTIDDEASLGERMITVSTSVEDEDGDDLDSVTLAITVAGPPHTYSVDGPEYIGLGESGTFTVTAVDEEGGLPYFTTVDDDATSADERNDRVSVFVADVPAGNVRGLTSGDDLVLDTDTGMGTFTVYAPRDAGQGELARIFVSEGDSEVSGSVTFGEEPPENVAPMAEGSIDDQMVDAGSYVMVDVSGYFSDADMDTLTYTAESDMMDYATTSVDGSMVTITGVAMGTATITVTAMDPDGMSDTQTFMVTVEEANRAPMAGMAIADQMVDAGSMVMVQSNFSDPDEDMLSYSADSSDDMIATASVDDMGMVTITGVAMGTATITVTATDPDGMSDTQTFMVTVEAAAPAMLTAPADVTAMSDAPGMVTVSWTPGEGAVGGHLVLLFTSDFTDVPGIETPPDGTNTENFTGIAAGDYVAVVVSIKSRSEYLYDYATVTVN